MALVTFSVAELQTWFDERAARTRTWVTPVRPPTSSMVRAHYRAMQEAEDYRDVRKVLEDIDDRSQSFGVEGVAPEGGGQRGPSLDYVNTGDTYDATIGYDTGTSSFIITSWGGWVENAEADLALENPPEEAECAQCNRSFPIDALDDELCRECQRRNEPPPTWKPRPDQPLVAVLRSVEGAPIAVHMLNREALLGFSAPVADGVFYAEHPGFAFNRTWPSLVDAFRRGQDDLYVTSIRTMPQQMFSIERGQFERLTVAMDAFMETGDEYQPIKEMLQVPEVLWTCDQISHVRWHEERGDSVVEAFVGDYMEDGSILVWSARSPELEQLIEDGLIAWKNNDSVRDYLQDIGVCRAK